jgi:hypothetical protein
MSARLALELLVLTLLAKHIRPTQLQQTLSHHTHQLLPSHIDGGILANKANIADKGEITVGALNSNQWPIRVE